jgi:hypothetical protein
MRRNHAAIILIALSRALFGFQLVNHSNPLRLVTSLRRGSHGSRTHTARSGRPRSGDGVLHRLLQFLPRPRHAQDDASASGGADDRNVELGKIACGRKSDVVKWSEGRRGHVIQVRRLGERCIMRKMVILSMLAFACGTAVYLSCRWSSEAMTTEGLDAAEYRAIRNAIATEGPITASPSLERLYPRVLIIPKAVEASYAKKPDETVKG